MFHARETDTVSVDGIDEPQSHSLGMVAQEVVDRLRHHAGQLRKVRPDPEASSELFIHESLRTRMVAAVEDCVGGDTELAELIADHLARTFRHIGDPREPSPVVVDRELVGLPVRSGPALYYVPGPATGIGEPEEPDAVRVDADPMPLTHLPLRARVILGALMDVTRLHLTATDPTAPVSMAGPGSMPIDTPHRYGAPFASGPPTWSGS
jgi:hypothetical protein